MTRIKVAFLIVISLIIVGSYAEYISVWKTFKSNVLSKAPVKNIQLQKKGGKKDYYYTPIYWKFDGKDYKFNAYIDKVQSDKTALIDLIVMTLKPDDKTPRPTFFAIIIMFSSTHEGSDTGNCYLRNLNTVFDMQDFDHEANHDDFLYDIQEYDKDDQKWMYLKNGDLKMRDLMQFSLSFCLAFKETRKVTLHDDSKFPSIGAQYYVKSLILRGFANKYQNGNPSIYSDAGFKIDKIDFYEDEFAAVMNKLANLNGKEIVKYISAEGVPNKKSNTRTIHKGLRKFTASGIPTRSTFANRKTDINGVDNSLGLYLSQMWFGYTNSDGVKVLATKNSQKRYVDIMKILKNNEGFKKEYFWGDHRAGITIDHVTKKKFPKMVKTELRNVLMIIRDPPFTDGFTVYKKKITAASISTTEPKLTAHSDYNNYYRKYIQFESEENIPKREKINTFDIESVMIFVLSFTLLEFICCCGVIGAVFGYGFGIFMKKK
eukprot:323302_1